MVIYTTTTANFRAYLRTFPKESILFSSIRGNISPAPYFGAPEDETYGDFEFVLHYQGVCVHYQFKEGGNENSLMTSSELMQLATEQGIVVIPVEEGDHVDL